MKWFTVTQQAEAFFKHDHHTGVWCLQPPDKHTKGFIIKQWDDQIILKILTDWPTRQPSGLWLPLGLDSWLQVLVLKMVHNSTIIRSCDSDNLFPPQRRCRGKSALCKPSSKQKLAGAPILHSHKKLLTAAGEEADGQRDDLWRDQPCGQPSPTFQHWSSSQAFQVTGWPSLCCPAAKISNFSGCVWGRRPSTDLCDQADNTERASPSLVPQRKARHSKRGLSDNDAWSQEAVDRRLAGGGGGGRGPPLR